jgi:hypothetical protein
VLKKLIIDKYGQNTTILVAVEVVVAVAEVIPAVVAEVANKELVCFSFW